MTTYTIYDTTTGDISRVVGCPENSIAANVNAGEDYIVGNYVDDKYYIVLGSPVTATPRKTMSIIWDKTSIVADGVDTATASGVPVGTEVTVDGGGMTTILNVNDGTLELTVDAIDTYTVKMDVSPYLQYEATIDGTA